MSDDELLRNPDEETQLGWQNDKETQGASATDEPPPWKIGDELGDFVLEKLLGSGSSGFVYRALDTKTHRRCALKLLKHGSPDDLLRNKLGFRRMMSLEHPNLLRVDRIHQLGNYIALSMEEVKGLTFNRAVDEFRKHSTRGAYATLLHLMRDFASGLVLMHANGYVHRDIKPENLMVDRPGRGRVIDYGLVDSYEWSQTTYGGRGFLLGTPHYFAPEVIWSQRYLPAGDIFSLGIVMLDALRRLQHSSGTKLHGLKRSNTNQVDDAERIDEAIEDLADSVPTIIRDACREMLDRHPSERPTALELSRLGLPASHRIAWPNEEPIVGRQREQQQITSWIDGIFAGNVGRLHLTGDSGVGKSRLVKEAIRYIESKNWAQVFTAQCRRREDQPLQAFDQICDAIANRYMQGDRERLELDPVSVTILQSVFPVLKNVLSPNLQPPREGKRSERLDGLEAAARMSKQLRQVGPLFVVIDDFQWADRDSQSVLDRIQAAQCGVGMGIITVSSQPNDADAPTSAPPAPLDTLNVPLDPLDLEDAMNILANAARRWSIHVSKELLSALAQSAEGNAFRLCDLADEFRPGGALNEIETTEDSAITDLAGVDRLWQRRAERLSEEARRVLIYVVTAGGRVSTQQLGELTGLAGSVDAAVSELSRQRLINDEATGGECITIVHDQIASHLLRRLPEQAKSQAHHDWATLLVRQNHPEKWAARIAGHFFSAGQPGRAVAHAILAAEDADRRVAKAEAGRWYAKVVDHVVGSEKINHLRNAARCYQQAELPVEAFQCYQRLIRLVPDPEQIECLMLATAMLVRCGRFSHLQDHLQQLAAMLRVTDGISLPLPSVKASR